MRTKESTQNQEHFTQASVSETSDLSALLPAFTRFSLDPLDAADDEALRSPPPSGPTRSNSGKVAYVVFSGHKTGIFNTWESTSAQLVGYPGNRFRGYKSLADAEAAWIHACNNEVINTPLSTPSRPAAPSPRQLPTGPLRSEEMWYAVVRGVRPGVYQGRKCARAAIGGTTGKAIKAVTEEEANGHFVRWWMAGNIVAV